MKIDSLDKSPPPPKSWKNQSHEVGGNPSLPHNDEVHHRVAAVERQALYFFMSRMRIEPNI